MENLEKIKESENSIIPPDKKQEMKDDEFGWSDKEIKEVLSESKFYQGLSEEAVNDIVQRIKDYHRSKITH